MRTLSLPAAGVALLLSALVALAIGPVRLPVGDVVDVVGRRAWLPIDGVSPLTDQIVWELRLPRVLGAAAVGAGLAVCGAVLQSLTRNDLADPYLLGIASGASVGAVTVIVLGVGLVGLVGSAAVAVAAFAGALLALGLVLALATGSDGTLPPARTVLAGVAVAQACTAYTSFVVIVRGDTQAARRVLDWTLGSVAGLRLGPAVGLLVLVAVGTLLIWMCSDLLDAFAFGQVSAASLGVPVQRVRWALLVGTALMTACLVAYVGAIGFVGLVVPHVVRLLVGPGHLLLLPLTAVVGAIVLLWADTAARTVAGGQEIPIGVVTGLVGAPFFAWLLRRERSSR